MDDSSAAAHPTSALIERAVNGDHKAMRELVRDLTPAIRAAVSWVLSRGPRGGREGRQEVEDVTQTVLLALFADRGRVLLQWDPARGLDLASFVALLARREAVSVLRSRRRNPWTEDPTQLEDLDRNAVMRMGPESEAISRDMLAALAGAVRERLSERGAEIFELMFMKGLPAEEVCDATGMSPDAVYAWKSRLIKQLREIIADLAATPPTIPPPAPSSHEGVRSGPVSHVPRSQPQSRIPHSRPSAPDSRAPRSQPDARSLTKTGPIPRVPRIPPPPPSSVPEKTGPIPKVRRAAPPSDEAAPPPTRRAAGDSSPPGKP